MTATGFESLNQNPDILEALFERARTGRRRLVFPEGEDARVIQAAYRLHADRIVHPILLADPNRFESERRELNLPPAAFEIISPSADLERYTALYQSRRAHKGIDRQTAAVRARDPLFRAALMVHGGEADACVGGAMRTTADTVSAALQCIGPSRQTVSSFFLMVFTQTGRHLLFADCGVIPVPTAPELAQIAIDSAHAWHQLFGTQARVAMLAYSTRGSAGLPPGDPVIDALALARAMAPDLAIDGELQADAALVPAVAALKAPDSILAGEANVLIFPNLHAGNIAYKLTQRLAGALALGPILQGLKKPMNDLSRGCSVEDIALVAAISAIQCESA